VETRHLDERSGSYNEPLGDLNRRFFSRTAARLLSAKLGAGPYLMLGLGDGEVANELAQLIGPLRVVEGSASLVERTALNRNVTVDVALFEEYEPAESFGTVIASHVLEHVEDPAAVLRRATRWVAPKGQLIATVPNADSMHRRVGVALGLLGRTDDLNAGDRALGHRRVYSVGSLAAELASAGWLRESFGGFHLKVVSNAQMADWSIELLDAMFEVSLGLPPECAADLWAVCRSAVPAAG
jgi:SAM-dependent methyltransferase